MQTEDKMKLIGNQFGTNESDIQFQIEPYEFAPILSNYPSIKFYRVEPLSMFIEYWLFFITETEYTKYEWMKHLFGHWVNDKDLYTSHWPRTLFKSNSSILIELC